MTASTPPATLLVFTRGPVRESRRKRLLPGRLEATETAIHERGLEQALESGRRAGCKIVISSPAALELPPGVGHHLQRGRTFGERFADAFARAQAASDGPVLAVGTDTPELSAADLEEALRRLAKAPDSVVVGPATDGGFYLLASRRPLASVDWTAVAWNSSRTRRTLGAALRAAGCGLSFLEPRSDLDRRGDLEQWLKRARRLLRRGGESSPWEGLSRIVEGYLALAYRPLVPRSLELPAAPDVRRTASRAPPGRLRAEAAS